MTLVVNIFESGPLGSGLLGLIWTQQQRLLLRRLGRAAADGMPARRRRMACRRAGQNTLGLSDVSVESHHEKVWCIQEQDASVADSSDPSLTLPRPGPTVRPVT